jgi:COP9 signalosome complex subunit 6
VVNHFSELQNAIKVLYEKIVFLTKYLEAVKAGKLKKDHSMLRRIASLTNRLPVMDSPKFSSDFVNVII